MVTGQICTSGFWLVEQWWSLPAEISCIEYNEHHNVLILIWAHWWLWHMGCWSTVWATSTRKTFGLQSLVVFYTDVVWVCSSKAHFTFVQSHSDRDRESSMVHLGKSECDKQRSFFAYWFLYQLSDFGRNLRISMKRTLNPPPLYFLFNSQINLTSHNWILVKSDFDLDFDKWAQQFKFLCYFWTDNDLSADRKDWFKK